MELTKGQKLRILGAIPDVREVDLFRALPDIMQDPADPRSLQKCEEVLRQMQDDGLLDVEVSYWETASDAYKRVRVYITPKGRELRRELDD